MANLSKTTQDHEEIRRWAEERGGKPSHVKSTGSGEDVGILRIDFPGFSGEGSLEPISWEQWFDKFDERKLALLYEEQTAGGERSNFNKIVSAETAAENERGSHRKGTSKKSASKKKSAPAKKTAAAKTAGKKSGAGTAAKKGAGKKPASKKSAPAKKTASKKSGASSSAGKKAPAKKTAAKKATAKKSRASAKKPTKRAS